MAYIETIKLRFPDNYIGITRGYSSSHRGIDLGWNTNYGGQNCNIYAPMDGTVVAVMDSMNNTYSSGIANWGNFVKIDHGQNVYTLLAHLLKGSITSANIKVGTRVTRTQLIGKMNNSGYSNGSHLHYEVYNGGADTSFRVDPLKYTYVYQDQVVSPNTEFKSMIRYRGDYEVTDERKKDINEAYGLISDALAILKPYIKDRESNILLKEKGEKN